jgi:hypothetical protein
VRKRWVLLSISVFTKSLARRVARVKEHATTSIQCGTQAIRRSFFHSFGDCALRFLLTLNIGGVIFLEPSRQASFAVAAICFRWHAAVPSFVPPTEPYRVPLAVEFRA